MAPPIHTIFDKSDSKEQNHNKAPTKTIKVGSSIVHTLDNHNDENDENDGNLSTDELSDGPSSPLPPFSKKPDTYATKPAFKKAEHVDDMEFLPSDQNSSDEDGEMQEFDEDASNVDDIDDMNGDRLGEPDMDEGSSIGSDKHEEEDENGEIKLKAGGVSHEDVEKSVRSSQQLVEIRAIQGQKFKAMVVRQHVDAIHNKDKEDDELDDIQEWGDDAGAQWYLQPDPTGAYELVDGVYKTKSKRDRALKRVEKKKGKEGKDDVEDGAFPVQFTTSEE